jgi:beta-mannosidase
VTWREGVEVFLTRLFGRSFPLDPWEELALAVNIYCADLFKFAIEWSRSRKWRKTGVLWWSLLDMWPMMFNYSVVDYRFRPKQPCFDWIRNSQQPLCLMIADAGEGDLELVAANDTLESFAGHYRIVEVDPGDRESELDAGAFTVIPN